MSLIYEKNIKSLTKNQSDLIQVLNETNIKENNLFRVIEGKKGHKVLQVKQTDGKYLNYNSVYDPYKEATKITSMIDYQVNRSMIVAVGVGLGYHLKESLNKLNSKSLILAVEENKTILKNLLHEVDFSNYIEDEKIFFVTGKFNEDNLKGMLSDLVGKLFPNTFSIQPLILNVSDVNYIRFSKEVFRTIQGLKDKYKFLLGNDVDDTILGIHNRIRNLPHVIKNPGINELIEKYKDVYKGKPAIIIASGPSLDKNIHFLKEAKGKALLLACDGSMSALAKYGIVPDAVSSVERIMLTYEAFYKGVKMPEETVLVAPAVVRPEIFSSFQTKTLSNFKYEGISAWFNKMSGDKGHIWAGISVAHQLIGFAQRLQADPIILVGQDLAYSEEGVTHVNEASVKEKVDISKVDIYVKGINGKDVPTTFVWKQFKEVYEMFIQHFKLNVIDATEGGAFIEGTSIMPLQDAISKYCKVPTRSLRELVDSLNVENDIIEDTHLFSLKSLKRLEKKFGLLKKKAEKSKILNIEARKLIKNGVETEEELDKVYTAIEYTENRIVQNLKRDPGMYMLFQYHIMRTVYNVNQLGTEVTFDVLKRNLDIQYDLLENICLYCAKMLHVFEDDIKYFKEKSFGILSKDILDKY